MAVWIQVRSFLIALCICFSMQACTHGLKPGGKARGGLLYAWTELAPDSKLLARAIVEGAECPMVQADGRDLPMEARAAPSAEFPALVCEAVLGSEIAEASLAGQKLATIPRNLSRILVIGDTGCQVKITSAKTKIQPCHDPAGWPFAQIAGLGAEWKPDLILHVGDFHYRESECPAGHPECAGSPTGDNWPSWDADFFSPARPLLGAAPWIFLRGNHETCNLAGKGWFLLLDPWKKSNGCQDFTPYYPLSLPGLELAVIDSGSDKNFNPSLAALSEELKASHKDHLWVLTHRPFLTPGGDDEATGKVKVPDEFFEPGLVSLVLAGHIHAFSANRFEGKKPPEVITGNGGALLDKGPFPYEKNPSVTKSMFHPFGFLTMEKTGTGNWKMLAHDRNGVVVWHCELTESRKKKSEISCTQ